MNSQIAYLNQNWLDEAVPAVAQASMKNTSSARRIQGGALSSNTLNPYNNGIGHYNGYPWISPTYVWPYQTQTKIRLTLSEVEHMRKCAAKDAKLKAALQKIAPHVEVEVDF